MPLRRRAMMLLSVLLPGCQAGIEPGGPPPVVIAADASLDGMAFTSSAATLTLTTAVGTPIAFEPVVFRVPPFSVNGGALCPGSESQRERTDTTDDRGRVPLCYRRSGRAGTDTVRIAVPERLFEGRLLARVTPGEPAAIRLLPPDTAVPAGASVTVRAVAIDLFGNDFPVEVALDVSGPGTLSGSRVAAREFGRIVVTGRLDTLEATATISVVPAGRLAALEEVDLGAESRVVGMRLDGMDRALLSAATAAPPRTGLALSPDGRDAYFASAVSGSTRLVRQRVGSTATPVRVTIRGDGEPDELLPQVAARSGELLFTIARPAPVRIHVINATGSVSALTPLGTTGTSDQPSPSPDGVRVAFVLDEGVGPALRMMARATRAMEPWRVERAQAPSWSPDGARIAFSRDGALGLVNADGTGLRVVPWTGGPGEGFHGPLSWSPDGRYLLSARRPGGGPPQVVRVEDGLAVPLGEAASRLGFAIWRP